MRDAPVSLALAAHPLLRVAAFTTRFPAPLGEIPTRDEVRALLGDDAPAPLRRGPDSACALIPARGSRPWRTRP